MNTTAVRINLLPHREQKRVARQRQFVSLTVLVVVMSLGVVGLVHFVLASQIDNQNSRNALVKAEIVKLDDQIKEIDKLREQIAQVLSRKQVVETLQANRNEAVHLLDQLVRQLPDGIYLRSIKQVGTKVTVVGYAQSNARVSTLMRNIDASPWVAQPELVEIKLVPMPASAVPPGARNQPNPGDRINEFTLNVQVKRAAPPPDPRIAASAPAAKPATPGAPASATPASTPAPTPVKPVAPAKAALAAKDALA
ncbi:MAG TPA: PilN domain-containing protein [Casimicrobiaceae bacterium]|nr:PilN domain-containing protein [Casimicrobiaceae bacterium]